MRLDTRGGNAANNTNTERKTYETANVAQIALLSLILFAHLTLRVRSVEGGDGGNAGAQQRSIADVTSHWLEADPTDLVRNTHGGRAPLVGILYSIINFSLSTFYYFLL